MVNPVVIRLLNFEYTAGVTVNIELVGNVDKEAINVFIPYIVPSTLYKDETLYKKVGAVSKATERQHGVTTSVLDSIICKLLEVVPMESTVPQ